MLGCSAAVLAGTVGSASAQTARIQVIHNSPDPAVEWLSLYLNDIKVADSLLFRNAKPYVEVPAGTGIQAGFAPLNSTSPAEIFKTVTVNLEAGKDYVAVILGVVDPNYRTNPDGLPISLNLLVKQTRPLAASLETSDYLFVNGVTDTPNLDFRPRNGDPIASGVPFGSSAGYVAFNRYVYTMDVATTDAPDRILGFFDLDVGFLKDKAFTVLTSGFLDRWENGNGPEFKLMIVASSGLTQTYEPESPTDDIAGMQVINNSPDLDFVNGFDIYFNGGRAINDLHFKDATPIFGLPGNATITIEVKNSTGGLSIRSTTLTVEPGVNYLVMVTGVVNTAQYAPNLDGEPTDLAISINPNLRLFPSQLGVGEFIFVHGVPDAPMADMEITDLPDPITNIPFGEMTAYHAISEFNILAEMMPSDGDLPAITRNNIEIPFVLGRTFVLYSAGFLRPERNRNGPRAELILALTNGLIVELRFREVASQAARLQLAHSSPDPAFQSVDLYVDWTLVADDALYQTATPFIDVPSQKTVTVSLAPSGSQGAEDAVAAFPMQFEEGVAYAGIVNGVGDPGDFAPNPEGAPTALGLHVVNDVLEDGLDGTQLTVRASNEITDAPGSNVLVEYTQMIAQGVGYAEHGDYAIVQAQERFVDVRRAAQGNRIGGSYFSFEGLAGRAGILVASGFADPDANGNGPGFSTFLVLDDGSTVHADQNVVSAEDDQPGVPTSLTLHGNYPNPFSGATQLVFDLPEPAQVGVSVLDATGKLVLSLEPRPVPAGLRQTISISAEDLPAGMYIYSVTAASSAASREMRGRMVVIR
ncbi:MAG TPA: DUF4397 domain-containing protein [Rhodothermia bacterium]